MATKKAAATGSVRARILRDCWLGQAGAVLELDPGVAEAAAAQGAVDTHPAAVQQDETHVSNG